MLENQKELETVKNEKLKEIKEKANTPEGKLDKNGNNFFVVTEFERKEIIHFAGVGSGMNFYNNPQNITHGGYMGWAKSQYVIYQKLFYDENTLHWKKLCGSC